MVPQSDGPGPPRPTLASMRIATTDLLDAHPDLQVADPIFRDFGGREAFAGPVQTLAVFEDNTLVRHALEAPGEGKVLVVDGGGSLRCALVGDRLAALGVEHGWVGIVVNGCVRDTAELARLPIGIKALAAHPRRSEKRGQGRRGVAVEFAGVGFEPGAWCYADADGIVVAAGPVHLDGPSR
jgi:regulator of ribonuclease activity A